MRLFFALFPVGKKRDSTSLLEVGTASALELMDVGSLCLADVPRDGGAEEAGVQDEDAEATNQARLFLDQAAKRRKKEEEEEKRVPRTSSHSSWGRARRQQRQRHVRTAGFPGDDLPRAVFPSSVGLPELPGILVDVFQKDSGVLFVDTGSGMSQAGFADFSPRAVFLSIVAWPLMLRILAGIDKKDCCTGIYKAGLNGDNAPRAVFSSLVGSGFSSSWPIWTRRTVVHLAVACSRLEKPVTMHLPLFSPCLQAHDAGHHGFCGPKGQLQ